ncbi:MAG: hypothetical protein AAF788_05580 [Pseudomonadota bacterium]
MRPNFHAIEAIAYGFRFGLTGLPTFLRLGWLPIVLLVGSMVWLQTNASWNMARFIAEPGAIAEASLGSFSEIFADRQAQHDQTEDSTDSVLDDFDADDITDDIGAIGPLTGEKWLAIFGIFVSALLIIPAFVGAIRQAAGVEPRGGVLPLFGREEWSTVGAALLMVPITFLASAMFAGPFFGFAIWAKVSGSGIAATGAFLFGIVAFFGFIWFIVRANLFTTHAAITGQIAFGEAFGISSGRYWKLLATFILIWIIFIVISLAVQLLYSGMGFVLPAAVSLGFLILVQLYVSLAQIGIIGRIVGDLLGLTDDDAYGDLSSPAGDDHVDDLPLAGSPSASPREELSDEQETASFVAEPEAFSEQEEPVMRRRDQHQPVAAFADAPEPSITAHAQPRKSKSSVQFLRTRFR